MRAVGTGEHGEPPATIVALSGDVHHAYLAEVAFPKGTGMRSTAWQAVCSPFRNPLDNKERRMMRVMASAPARVIMRGAGAQRRASAPSVRWRYVHDEPWFDNQVATLDARRPQRATVRLEKTLPPEDPEHPALKLERVFERDLS